MDRRRKHERQKSAEAAEIGPLPEVVDPDRRQACGESLPLFLATYFPHSTGLSPFSADHLQVIDRIERGLRHGGRFVNAVFRGFAKTTITENAALWAVLYGLRKFIAIFGADKYAAKQLVQSIGRELCENDLLLEDFPEACVAFRALMGKHQRGASQTHRGELTHVVMTSETIVMPTIWYDEAKAASTPSSGCIIRSRGLLAAALGQKHKQADGTVIRPDFALLDDIQTVASAQSVRQVQTRLRLIRESVLKSAGHNKAIACVLNATPFACDDVVEQFLDQERNPSWDGVRVPMVKRWADAHETLWQEYAKIRRHFDRAVPGDQQRAAAAATAFYREQQPEMDAGCVVTWAGAFDRETELSAIQHAYNLLFDDPPEVFASQCQIEPVTELPTGVQPVDAITICRKLSGHARGEVPSDTAHLTAAIDVHGDVLYWAVVAWRLDCTGWVVDYGTWPDQRMAYFAKRQATRTLGRRYPGTGPEGALIAGLTDSVTHVCGRDWHTSEGTPIRIAKLLVDASWSPDQVEHVARTSQHAAVIQVSKGVGIGAAKCPISEYPRKTGRTLGDHWYIESRGKRPRLLHPDTNYWKTWLHARLSEATTAAGSISLFGRGDVDHKLLADHLVAERPQQVTSETHRRTVIEWALPPGRDNHWLDCLVYCAVAGNLLGCRLGATAGGPVKTSRRGRALAAAQAKGLMPQ
jgi:hypothetical protein